MFKSKLPQQNQGFTLVEVLVAILITTVFVAVAMQAIAIAAVFKARAKQYTEATNWIQEDLENVKSQATLPLPSTTLTTATGSALVVASIARFEVGDQLKVGTDSTNNVIQSINPSTSTINLNATLGSTPSSGASVEVIKSIRCNATTADTGFGDYLNDNMPALSPGDTKTILGKIYTLTRTPTVRDVAPYEVLKLTYSVTPQGSGSAIATTNTEVIPDAAFQCP